MPLPPAKKQKTLACLRKVQVHKHWTKVYFQKGLTAMYSMCSSDETCKFHDRTSLGRFKRFETGNISEVRLGGVCLFRL